MSLNVEKIIVGICGKAAVGKDTLANYLVSKRGFKKETFAAPLKRLVGDIFGVPDCILNPVDERTRWIREQPLKDWQEWTPRKLLQYIGTELFRDKIDKDIWAKALCNRIDIDTHPFFVISDVRFPNEIKILKDRFNDNFFSIHILRDGHSGHTEGGMKAHESESYNLECNYTLFNNASIEDLCKKADGILDQYLANRKLPK